MLKKYNSPLFAIQSVKMQNYFFKKWHRAKKISKKFKMNLFSRIEEWKNFAGTNFRRFAKKPQNPRKLIS